LSDRKQRPAHPQLYEKRRRNAANFLYHFWRVTSEVAAQRLENAHRGYLQGESRSETKAAIAIETRSSCRSRIAPRQPEKTGRAASASRIFAQNAGLVSGRHNRGRKIVLDNVPDEAAEMRCRRQRHRHPDIGQRAGARKS
jgi:hypothetical protein